MCFVRIIWAGSLSSTEAMLDMQEMGGRLWRNREASCNALSDLLQGRRWPELKDKLSDIWSMVLRAVDDIKESVRGAAAILVKTLRNLTLRLCDPQVTASKEAGQAVSLALPLMLQKGKLTSRISLSVVRMTCC